MSELAERARHEALMEESIGFARRTDANLVLRECADALEKKDDEIAQLIYELDKARATLERCEQLADLWELPSMGGKMFARRLRNEIKGTHRAGLPLIPQNEEKPVRDFDDSDGRRKSPAAPKK